MLQHSPTSVLHRTDVKTEITHLLERLFELVEARPHPPSAVRRPHLYNGREEETVEPVMIHLETDDAFFLVLVPPRAGAPAGRHSRALRATSLSSVTSVVQSRATG